MSCWDNYSSQWQNTPVPMESPADCKNPSYKHTEGRILSKFIIDIAAPSLHLIEGSLSNNGYPKGLFMLILAALECAVWLCLKPANEIQEFLNEFWARNVKEIAEDQSDNENADLLILDNNHAFLFDFTSPSKPWA
ncbi:hypothetical protein BJ912DRAFT_937970 [Pholiota molesta]|nr:hypothetical protein BJ912DRAFT_937970 [Pholiota molesta]